MLQPQEYQFDLPASPRPAPSTIPEQWYPGIASVWPKCTSKRVWDPILGVRTVVIHATAGGSSEGAISVMNANKASWHWLVPDENESQHGKLVWACAPEARAAWHVRNSVSHPDVNGGANRTNHSSLGIEIVNTQLSNDAFSDWQVGVTAEIVRYCWAKYPNLKHVVSHAKLDPSRRTDPGTNFPWLQLKQRVLDTSLFASIDKEVATAIPANLLPATTDSDICCTP